MRRAFIAFSLMVLGVAGLVACVPQAPQGSAPCGFLKAGPAKYQHIVWIWMENKHYGDVIGNSAAPYETSLAHQCSTLTSYHTVGSPSLPNYIGATAGSTFGIADDAGPSSHVLTADNLFRQVRAANGTAKSYEEGIPSNCAVSGGTDYAVKHNPAAYYVGGSDHQACLQDDLPLSSFDPYNLATFSFVTPNLCHDTHDCSVNTGDKFLAGFVPAILNSAAYRQGNVAVVIVHDEYTPLPNVILSESVRPGAVSSASVSHYNLLATTEQVLSLPCLGSACGAGSLRAATGL